MAEPGEFLPFPDAFINSFIWEGNSQSITTEDVRVKQQVLYLRKYLLDLDCKTMLVEQEYVDHDFLDDYASYYAKCFAPYGKLCQRLHFFRDDLCDLQLDRAIIDNNEDQIERLRKSYLGFVVVKPLPDAIVGRTVVSTYPPDENRRFFPVTRDYPVNLFGLELQLKTLASQEQDTVLAACATTALWSAFHKSSDLFGVVAPTPSEITRSATHYIQNTRPIPTHGLNVEQMCWAISENGLVPEVYEIGPDLPLNSVICSYVKAGIPVILGYQIAGNGGRHAVTISGYRSEQSRIYDTELMTPEYDLRLNGQHISEFYAHDDNLGPFSRLKCLEDRGGASKGKISNLRLFQRDIDLGRFTVSDICIPEILIVPIYHKIRLRFVDVLTPIKELDSYLKFLGIRSVQSGAPVRFEWDIHVISLRDLKNFIRDSDRIEAQSKKRFLFASLPRYCWIGTASLDQTALFSVVIDATGIARSFFLGQMIFHQPEVKRDLRTIITKGDPDLVRASEANLSSRFTDFVRKEILTE